MRFEDLPVGARFRDSPTRDWRIGKNLCIQYELTKTAEDEATFELNGKSVTVSWEGWLRVDPA